MILLWLYGWGVNTIITTCNDCVQTLPFQYNKMKRLQISFSNENFKCRTKYFKIFLIFPLTICIPGVVFVVDATTMYHCHANHPSIVVSSCLTLII